MKYVPKSVVNSVTRFGYRQLLKFNKNSPTILVVSGVVGLGVTAVMASKASRRLDPILDEHAKQRIDLSTRAITSREEQKQIVKLYSSTTVEMAKLYGPTIIVGTLSAASILYGHRILQGRHLATMAAYSGLMEQYKAYRARVAETVGEDMERDIYAGAVGKYEEDPNHPGEYKQISKFPESRKDEYLRPFFDEVNVNWTTNPVSNYLFLKGVQEHMNRLLQLHGHLFLFEVYDALGMPRPKESIVSGWIHKSERGDGYVDLGFMTDPSPEAQMFRAGEERSVRLNFNIDGVIWDLI